MMDGVFKDFLLNVSKHYDMDSGKSGLCPSCQAKNLKRWGKTNW